MDFSNIVVTYGLEASCIAAVTIMLIGIIKLIFKKRLAELGSAACKSIYESLCIVFAYGLTAAWLALSVYVIHLKDMALTWQVCLETGSISYVVVKVMYPLYENYHVRDLLKMIGKAIFQHKAKVVMPDVVETIPAPEEPKPVEKKAMKKGEKPVMLEGSRATVKSPGHAPRITNKGNELGNIDE